MKKILLITLTLVFTVSLTACGGEEGGSANAVEPINQTLTKEEIEVKFNLPPEPDEDDPLFNTIKGIDSNGIRGRDDVERDLTFTFYQDEDDLNTLYAMSEDLSSLTARSIDLGNGSGSKDDFKELFEGFLLKISCYSKKGGRTSAANIEYLTDKFLNTDDRYLNYYILEGYAPLAKVADGSNCQ